MDITVALIRGSTSFGKRLGITAWHLFFHHTVRVTGGNGCQMSLRIFRLVKVCGKRNAVAVVERDSRMFHLIALRKGLISFLRQFQWFHTGWIYIFCCCRFLCLTGDIYGFMTYRSSLHGGTFLFDGGTFECGSYPSWQFRARAQFFLRLCNTHLYSVARPSGSWCGHRPKSSCDWLCMVSYFWFLFIMQK